jgi:hypothetical protein
MLPKISRETRASLLAILHSFLFGVLVCAQTFELTPMFGYHFGGSFQAQGEGQTGEMEASLGDAPSYGFAAGVRFDELSLIEFRWTRARKELTVEGLSDRGDAILEKVTVQQFHGDFTREFVLEERHWLRPFLTGSVGAAYLAGRSKSFTRFSFGLGTGLKLFPHSRFGVRLQAQWLPVWVSPEAASFHTSVKSVLAPSFASEGKGGSTFQLVGRPSLAGT